MVFLAAAASDGSSIHETLRDANGRPSPAGPAPVRLSTEATTVANTARADGRKRRSDRRSTPSWWRRARLSRTRSLRVDRTDQSAATVRKASRKAIEWPAAARTPTSFCAETILARDSRQKLQSPLPQGQPSDATCLNQAANAAVKAKGTIFAIVYRRVVPRLGHAQAIGAITHRLCRLIWKILHQGIRYEERGPAVSKEAKQARARKMIRELRGLGYRVELAPPPATA